MLYTASNIGSLITRTYTNSTFDHVAVVVNLDNDDGELFLLEATGGTGVSLNTWSFLRNHIGEDKFYKKLIFRKVNFERGEETAERLSEFI